MKAFDKTFTKYREEVHPYYYKDDSYEKIYVKSSPSDDQLENNVCTIIFKVEYCSVHIYNIPFTGYENKGYGSVAMRALIKHSINKGYLGITGLLSPRDPAHTPRLCSFYKKNSFDIKLNPTEDSGYIQLELTNPSELLERITLLENKLEEKQQNIANKSKFMKYLKKYF